MKYTQNEGTQWTVKMRQREGNFKFRAESSVFSRREDANIEDKCHFRSCLSLILKWRKFVCVYFWSECARNSHDAWFVLRNFRQPAPPPLLRPHRRSMSLNDDQSWIRRRRKSTEAVLLRREFNHEPYFNRNFRHFWFKTGKIHAKFVLSLSSRV